MKQKPNNYLNILNSRTLSWLCYLQKKIYNNLSVIKFNLLFNTIYN